LAGYNTATSARNYNPKEEVMAPALQQEGRQGPGGDAREGRREQDPRQHGPGGAQRMEETPLTSGGCGHLGAPPTGRNLL